MRASINKIYPWGRSFDEYRRMFALEDANLGLRILGCADGPAAFNAGMRRTAGESCAAWQVKFAFSRCWI